MKGLEPSTFCMAIGRSEPPTDDTAVNREYSAVSRPSTFVANSVDWRWFSERNRNGFRAGAEAARLGPVSACEPDRGAVPSGNDAARCGPGGQSTGSTGLADTSAASSRSRRPAPGTRGALALRAAARRRSDLDERWRVPMPPGTATQRSASSVMSALRSCIEATDAQFGESAVGDLAINQRLGDHADRLAAVGEDGLGEHAHQADLAAP
jgi:hypothetical protein